MIRNRKRYFEGGESEGIALGDMMSIQFLFWMLLALILSAMLVLLTSKKTPDSSSQINEVDRLTIEISWESGPYDIDVWLTEPGETDPVGFTRPAGKHCNLTRDDRGVLDDPSVVNLERITCRAPPVGEYVVHVQYYTTDDVTRTKPIDVTTILFMPDSATRRLKRYSSYTTPLTKKHDIGTVVSFTLLPSGEVDAASVNTIPRELFHGKR